MSSHNFSEQRQPHWSHPWWNQSRLVDPVGLHTLGSFADQLGLVDSQPFSVAVG